MWRAALIALAAMATTCADAQTPGPSFGTDHSGTACPPGAKSDAPTVGKDSRKPLSDQLADSKGIICPPAGVDPEMRQRPPAGGAIKVIPPPGSPDGDKSVQPK